MAVTVTLAGSGTQSVPYQSPQPPAGWRSLQVPVTSTAGNWMIAVVFWRQQAAGQNVTVHVGDNTLRNYWQPLGQPAGTSNAAGVVRCAIWTAPAAAAAEYVTVAPAGTVQAIGAIILNVAGMQPWETLAAISTTFANSASALSALSTLAPSAQALVITGACQDLQVALNFSGSGWTFLANTSTSNGADHTADLVTGVEYQVATGATSATWSAASTCDMAGITAGVLVTSTPPSQASAQWPVTVAELAPGAGPATPEDQRTWVPVTARALNLDEVVQGAQYNLAALNSGTGTLTLDNPDGLLIAQTEPAWQVEWNGNGSTAAPSIQASYTPVTAGLSYSWSGLCYSVQGWTSGCYWFVNWLNSGAGVISSVSGSASPVPVPAGVTAGTLVTLLNEQAPVGAVGAEAFLTMAGTPANTVVMQAAAGAQPSAYLTSNALTWTGANGATVTTLAAWTASWPGIDSGTPFRIRQYWATAPSGLPYSVPFAGYVRTWPQAWDPDLYRGVVTAAITDAWAYCNGNLQVIAIQELLNDNPYALWPCTDPAGSTQASNYAAGNTNPLVMTISKYGSVASQAFGGNGTALLGEQGTYLLTSGVRAYTSAGMWGQTTSASPGIKGFSLACADQNYPPPSGGVTVEFFFQVTAPFLTNPNFASLLTLQSVHGNVLVIGLDSATTGTDPGQMFLIDGYGNSVIISPVNYMTGTPPLTHVALTFSTTGWTSYIDGVQTATGSWVTAAPAAFQYLALNGWAGTPEQAYAGVGGGPSLLFYTGYTGLVAVYDYQLTPARIMTHYQAGLTAMTGDFVNDRIERLLQAGGYTGRRVILYENGTITPATCSSTQDIASQPAATSISNIAASTVPAVLGVSPPGEVFYLPRAYVYNQTVRWVLGDNTGAGEIPYLDDITVPYDPLRVINDIQITQLDNQDIVTPQGAVATLDQASQLQYGDQSYWVTGYLENDLLSGYAAGPGLIDLANWIGQVNALPGNRIGQVTVDAATSQSAAAWTLFGQAAKGDMVTVNIRPITAPGLVLSITGRISQTTRSLRWSLDSTEATISLMIDLAAEQNVLTFDDPVRGQLTGELPLAW